jgi:hypothetical protein
MVQDFISIKQGKQAHAQTWEQSADKSNWKTYYDY